jgi:hypothetical protein
MNHLSEEELIGHYYGEEGDALAVECHLESCGECRSAYGSIQRVLNLADAVPVPDRDSSYADAVWERLQPRLPQRRRTWLALPAWRWAAAAAAFAGLVAAAFIAGRSYPGAPVSVPPAMADAQHSEGLLLVAVDDYLQRSQMVLVELSNADPDRKLNIAAQQERAGDLVSEARLYRQTAARTGDTEISAILEEIERVLVDIKNEPSELSPTELARIRERLHADGILFKIRVLGSTFEKREDARGRELQQAL